MKIHSFLLGNVTKVIKIHGKWKFGDYFWYSEYGPDLSRNVITSFLKPYQISETSVHYIWSNNKDTDKQ